MVLGLYIQRKYKVNSSFDGVNWLDLTDVSGRVVIFDANADSTNIVENPMPPSLITRHIRLLNIVTRLS